MYSYIRVYEQHACCECIYHVLDFASCDGLKMVLAPVLCGFAESWIHGYNPIYIYNFIFIYIYTYIYIYISGSGYGEMVRSRQHGIP